MYSKYNYSSPSRTALWIALTGTCFVMMGLKKQSIIRFQRHSCFPSRIKKLYRFQMLNCERERRGEQRRTIAHIGKCDSVAAEVEQSSLRCKFSHQVESSNAAIFNEYSCCNGYALEGSWDRESAEILPSDYFESQKIAWGGTLQTAWSQQRINRVMYTLCLFSCSCSCCNVYASQWMFLQKEYWPEPIFHQFRWTSYALINSGQFISFTPIDNDDALWCGYFLV